MMYSNDSSAQQRLQTKETSGFAAAAGQGQDKRCWTFPLTQAEKHFCEEGDLQCRPHASPLLNSPASSSKPSDVS